MNIPVIEILGRVNRLEQNAVGPRVIPLAILSIFLPDNDILPQSGERIL
jgi:hypothetical protein